MARLLTIAMAVHKDLCGPWMTIELIREFFPQLAGEIEFLVIDNAPYSDHGEALRNHIAKSFNRSGDGWVANYVSAAPRKSTSLRNLAFWCAETEYVLCVDSHVILRRESLTKLVRFLKSGAAGDDLYQGPVYTEAGDLYGTHMNPAFRGGNFGTWGVMQDEDGKHTFSEDMPAPFEIPMHGMGLFLARRESWVQFPINYQHFSGEEGYTQEKYRLLGRQAWCLPFLGWKHFYGGHVGGTNYPNTTLSKLRNHILMFRELSLDLQPVIDYFTAAILNKMVAPAIEEAKLQISYTIDAAMALPVQAIPRTSPPFLNFPVRINDYARLESEDYREFERRLPTPANR